MQQSDEHRLAAADVIERLQLQKTQLEREVLCNRRARELEAKLKEQVRVACFALRIVQVCSPWIQRMFRRV